MKSAEEKFLHDLDVFRTEVWTGTQYFYAYLTVQSVIGSDKKARMIVNETPYFWGTNISALQVSAFIALGRIFDNSSKHNVMNLIEYAKNNKSIFSKDSLANRKRKDSNNADEWLPNYLKKAHIPKPSDFKHLEEHVKKHKAIYDANYKKIRNKIFAHKEYSQKHQVERLFKNTKIRELEHIFVFLNKLYNALWELLHNGKKPILRPMPFSVKSMLKKKLPESHNKTIPESTVIDTKQFFEQLVKAQRIRHSSGTSKQLLAP